MAGGSGRQWGLGSSVECLSTGASSCSSKGVYLLAVTNITSTGRCDVIWRNRLRPPMNGGGVPLACESSCGTRNKDKTTHRRVIAHERQHGLEVLVPREL
jgi:hypothetical protein